MIFAVLEQWLTPPRLSRLLIFYCPTRIVRPSSSYYKSPSLISLFILALSMQLLQLFRTPFLTHFRLINLTLSGVTFKHALSKQLLGPQVQHILAPPIHLHVTNSAL